MKTEDDSLRVVILAQSDGKRVLFQDVAKSAVPGSTAGPTIESVEVFDAQWTGELILITSRASLAGALAKFDFTWFIPSMVKYRKLLCEVLLTPFMLQLFGLVSPLFFQVGMDKVLVRKGMNPLEVLSRHKANFQTAWEHRKELAGPARLADEMAFLPASLSLQDTPVHPAPRRLSYLLMGLFVLVLVWSIFGEVDIVTVAPGRIIVSDRTKVIQPLEASVVKAVLVKDGDKVKAGQVLVELDPTMATADMACVQEQFKAALSEEQRTHALLQVLSKETTLARALKGLEADPRTKIQFQSEWQDINAKLAKLHAESALRQAEIGTVKASIAKLEATLPMVRTREADFTKLVDQGFISGHATQDKNREGVEMERDLATQRARLSEAMATANETKQTKSAYRAETQRQLNDRYVVSWPAANAANSVQTAPKPPKERSKTNSRPRSTARCSNWRSTPRAVL